jgi:hypothetical protein
LAISIYFATHTFLEPRMALLYAPLFIILATAFVPQTFPQPGQSSPPEYFYWATGLFFITFAMALRLPWAGLLWERKRMGVLLSLVLFLLVSVAAGLQGLRLGFSVSYVARQFFGAALFIIYFYAGFVLPETQSEVTKYFHILKWFGTVASVYTIVFYIDYVDLPGNVDSFK